MAIKYLDSQEWKNLVLAKELDEDSDPIAIRKLLTPEIKEAGDGSRVLQFTISTSSVDRAGDKISQKGWQLDHYRKNPVVLWAHDGHQPPIARAFDIAITGNNRKMVAKAEFVPKDIYPFADMVYQMYRKGFLNATSVGFVPIEFERASDKEQEQRGPFAMDFKQQELLEYSAVPVPANPEALIGARKSGIDLEPLKDWTEQRLDSWDPHGCNVPGMNYRNMEEVYRHLTNRTVVAMDIEEKGAISWGRAHSGGTPVAPKNTEWDAGEVERNLPDDDMKGWLTVFTWYDSNAADPDGDGLPDAKSAWKLPHHKAQGKHAVVWKGVAAAMGALMGARGGVKIPDSDRRKVYNHLARHYKEDFNEDPPKFKYVEDQILKSGDYVMNLETGHPEKAEGTGLDPEKEAGSAVEKDLTEEQKAAAEKAAAEAAEKAAEVEKEVQKEKEVEKTADGHYHFHMKSGDIEIVFDVDNYDVFVESRDKALAAMSQMESPKDAGKKESKATTDPSTEKDGLDEDTLVDKVAEGLEGIDLTDMDADEIAEIKAMIEEEIRAEIESQRGTV